MDPQRPYTIITGVVREALRASGRKGVVLSGGGPEEALLEEWMARGDLPCLTPGAAARGQARGLLVSLQREAGTAPNEALASDLAGSARAEEPPAPGDTGSVLGEEAPAPGDGGSTLDAAASGIAGWALAWNADFLLAGTANKTSILLSGTLPIQPLLPLGDLYASQVAELAGAATLPPCLRGSSPAQIRAVDEALEAYLEEGFEKDEVFGEFAPPLGERIQEALALSRRAWRFGPLIPKLGRGTLGLDLDP